MKRMRQRTLCLLVAVLLLVTMLPRLEMPTAAAEIASGTCGKYVNWSLSDTGVLSITGTGSMSDYSSASDVPWYSQRASIKEVIIGYGVTDIGYKVFSNCSNLTAVTIGETVTRIDGYAFYRCTALTDIVIPDSVTYIGDNGFYGCSSLQSVTFQGAAPSIVSTCFTGVTATACYPCDDTTWTKTAKANYGGTLTWEETHNYVDGVCSGCLLDQDATVVASGTCKTGLLWRLNSKGVLTITGNGEIPSYSYMPNAPWYSRSLAIRTIVIGEGVTAIGDYAFSGCAYVTRVVLPDSLTSIGWGSFQNCTRLPDITIPAGVTNISHNAFQFCKSLSTIVFLGSAPYMKSAFPEINATAYHPCNDESWTDSAKTLENSSITWVGHVFDDYVTEQEATCTANAIATGTCPVCQATRQVAVPGSIAEHNYDAAETCVNCSQPRRYIVINMEDYGYGYGWDGEYIKVYADGALVTKATLEEFNYYGRVVIPYIPCVQYTFKWITDSDSSYPFNIVLGDQVFNRPLLKDGKVFCTFERQKPHRYQAYDTDPTCTVEGIIGNICLSCDRMETVDTVPATGHNYVNGVCTGCQLSQDKEIINSGTCGTGLQWQLDNEGTLTISGEGAMKNYYSAPELPPWSDYTIKKVVIGAGVTKLGYYALYNCTKLSRIIFQGSAPTAGYRTFYNVSATGYYPCSDTTWTEDAKDELSGVSYWMPLHNLDENGICQDCKHGPKLLIEMTTPDGTGWGDAAIEVYKNGTLFTTTTFGDGYTYRKAFDCVPNATYTFRWKKGTGSYGFTISRMGQVLVSGNSEEWTDGEVVYTLETTCPHRYELITVPATCTEDGSVTDACIYCGHSTVTILPATGHSYKNGLCTTCGYYDSTSCGDDLHWQLDGNGTLTITGTGPMIDFADASKAPWHSERSTIKAVFIGDGVTTIGGYAFYECANLTDVAFPESLTTIGTRAFQSCNGLKDLVLPEGVVNIANVAFYACSNLSSVTFPETIADIGGYAFKDCSSLKSVTFLGAAPYIDSTCFRNVTATVLYPCDGETWTDSTKYNYGGTLTWEANHRYQNGICSLCGDGMLTILPGDLDGDGNRTVSDVSRLYSHIQGTLPLDSESLAYADVNGDGSVDIGDTARLYAHVKGTNPLN